MKGPPVKKTGNSFGKYINEKLALFDRRQRIVAEKKIMDVLYEIEIGGTMELILTPSIMPHKHFKMHSPINVSINIESYCSTEIVNV